MDHESVNIRSTTMSCGVMELSRIDSDHNRVLYQIASHLYHPARGQPCAFIVWSDIWGELTNSALLRREILDRKYGQVEVSFKAENPRTGNIIQVYVWSVDHAKLKAWYIKQRVAKLRGIG